MTDIPNGSAGHLLSLRLDDHDNDPFCRLCPGAELRWPGPWQAGCPTTDLPAALPWRPATVTGPAVTRPAGPEATNPRSTR